MSTNESNHHLNSNSTAPSFDSPFGISTWHDTAQVYAQLDALLAQPIRPIKPENMQKVLRYFDEKCASSKRHFEEAKTVIPGGVQHNLAFNYPFGLTIKSVHGAYATDVDNNEYIDFLQAGGPTLLGSNPPVVREKVKQLLDECGPVTGLLHEYETKLAKLVCDLFPGVDMFRMLGSGTESDMAAIRLARAYTAKKWVVKIGGGYHGWSDQLVYGLRVPGTGRREAIGIPRQATAYTQECMPNDLNALRRQLKINRLRGGTAAVIVEPLGPESGTRPVFPDYNQKVRELCDEFSALLIFDEVVTGFRVGLSGAQGYFNVKPDITVFGKCITGGYPMAGGIGGKKDIMMLLAGGIGGKQGKKAFVGGTLTANPLSCLAGYYSILEMQRINAAQVAGRAGDRLCQGLQSLIKQYKLPYVAYNQGSIVHLQTSGVMLLDARMSLFNIKNILRVLREVDARKHMMEQMGAAYTAHGIITLAGSRIYTSAADTDAIIDDALNRFEAVFKLV